MRFLGMSQGQDFEMVDAARVDRDMHALRIASFQPNFHFLSGLWQTVIHSASCTGPTSVALPLLSLPNFVDNH
jgi:hypothetical protein